MEEYVRGVLQKVVAKTCQNIGFDSVTSTSLDFMTDLMDQYLKQISKKTQGYAELFGRIDGNLDDLGLAFKDLNINIKELAQYVKDVEAVECPVAVPHLPISRKNHIFFPEMEEEREPEEFIGKSPQIESIDDLPDQVEDHFNNLDSLDEEIQSYIPDVGESQKNMDRWILDDMTLPKTPTIAKTPEIRLPPSIALIQKKKEELNMDESQKIMGNCTLDDMTLPTTSMTPKTPEIRLPSPIEFIQKQKEDADSLSYEKKEELDNSHLPKPVLQKPIPSIIPYVIPCYNPLFPKPIFPLNVPVAASGSPPMIPSLPTSALLSNPTTNPKNGEMQSLARVEPIWIAKKDVKNEKVIEKKLREHKSKKKKKKEEKRKLNQEDEVESIRKRRKLKDLEGNEEEEKRREKERRREIRQQEREAEILKDREKERKKEKERHEREVERLQKREKERKKEKERERQEREAEILKDREKERKKEKERHEREVERLQKREKERERQEREAEILKKKVRQEEREKERQEREAEILKEREKEKGKARQEREAERDRERQRKRQKERERERQKERETARQREKKRQQEREIEKQTERQHERELSKPKEKEREVEKSKENEREVEKQRERARQKEKERRQRERERERQKEREVERHQKRERERQKEKTEEQQKPRPSPRVPSLKIIKKENPNQNFVATWTISSSQEKEKFHYFDQNGVEIWICPDCKKQDDGSVMIECDRCDLWYHLICTGLSVCPAENEKWYCQSCSVKSRENRHQICKKQTDYFR